MKTLQKRILGAAGILVLAGIGAYWYWSPYLVMRQMREAAIHADADAFNDHVDYPKLRESLKGQLSARITGEMANQSNSGNDFERAGAAFGSMLGLALVDRMVDAVVRPDMVMRAIENGKLQLQDGGKQETREAAAKVDIAMLSQAVKLYKLDHGVYPTEQQGLQILVDPAARPDGMGNYIDKLPSDPWGRPFQYANPGRESAAFEIYHLPPPASESDTTARKAAWRSERKGVDKIIVYLDTNDAPARKNEAAFVMRREGFANWKLTEIRLPE